MAKAKRKPPARARYEESHPTVSCRLSRDIHTLLTQRLADLDMSFADFVKVSLDLKHEKMDDIIQIRKTAWQSGYNKALKDWQIWYFCAVCDKRIDMKPNSDDHKEMRGYMSEHGWGHASCHKERR